MFDFVRDSGRLSDSVRAHDGALRRHGARLSIAAHEGRDAVGGGISKGGLGLSIDRSSWFTRGGLAFAQALERYHRHRVVHIERLGDVLGGGRRVVLVGNHALSVIDPLLFTAAVYRKYGIVPRFIGHGLGWFKTPVLRAISEKYRIIPSRYQSGAANALERDRFLMLFPGGATEAALRDYRREPYRLKWSDRIGFLRLALECDAEIMFVAAVGNDEAYYQSRLEVPRTLLRYFDANGGARYEGTRFPLGAFGTLLIPLPVQMTHVVSTPLDLGDRRAAREDERALAGLHARIWAECQSFLDEAVESERRRADLADRATRTAQGLLHDLGI